MIIRLVVTGRSYHTADGLPAELELPEGSSVDDALQAIGRLIGDDNPLSPSCLIAVSGAHIGTVNKHASRVLCDGQELTLIAPVAGG